MEERIRQHHTNAVGPPFFPVKIQSPICLVRIALAGQARLFNAFSVWIRNFSFLFVCAWEWGGAFIPWTCTLPLAGNNEFARIFYRVALVGWTYLYTYTKATMCCRGILHLHGPRGYVNASIAPKYFIQFYPSFVYAIIFVCSYRPA